MTGATLILTPLRPPTERWQGVFEAVTEAIAALDVALVQGVSACPPSVAEGAWIVAHDGSPNARVRWAQGSFATSPSAWRTDFVHFTDPRGPFVQGDDAGPFGFAVGESTG